MKTVAFSIMAFLILIFFGSCKNENEKPVSNNAVSDSIPKEEAPKFLYVLAPSGLTLREFNNLQSKKLAVIPFGTIVNIIKIEEKTTMDVGGIAGGMDEVEFNGQSGFAFNGYLSRFSPPQHTISAKDYALMMKETFPSVTYSETTGGSASNPSSSQTLLFPKAKWHEAFFIAQRLFSFPKEFDFPNPKGNNSEVLKDPNMKKNVWTSELLISRNNNTLDTLQYSYRTEGSGSQVFITQEGEAMKIEKRGFAD